MSIRTCGALLLAAGLPVAVFAADFPEIEPNETKAQALSNGAFVLAAGDSVSGNSTGGSTTAAGAASADTFLIKTTAAPLGIYRHRLTITTVGSEGHTGTIRGLNASSLGAGTVDSTVQTSASSTTPSRMNQWYGFGKQEQFFYRVAGVAATTGDYTSTLSTSTVLPTVIPGPIESGAIAITQDAATNTAYDMDMFLFDSNFNVIAGIDEPDTAPITANLAPGTYYVAYSRYNIAAGNAAGSSIIQGTWQTGLVLDFNDIVAASPSTVSTQPVGINIAHPGGTSGAVDVAPSSYEVAWFVFNVIPSTTPTNPSATDVTTPGSVVRDGVAEVTFRVTVVPGQVPTSTGLEVVVDDSSIGGTGSLSLNDDGLGADLIAGDNIFSGTSTVAYNTALGAATLPYTVTDDQSRSFTDALNFTVTEAVGACCTDSGCFTVGIQDCIDNRGGTFSGTGTACFTEPLFGELTTEGAGAFEDISGTGTVIAGLAGDDDATETVALPFGFSFFGNTYNSISVCTNGFAQFTGTSTTFTNTAIPSTAVPNNALYVLWDDHDFDAAGAAYTQLLGTPGVDARFIIQWNAGQYNLGLAPLDFNVFQIALFEDGHFEFRYQNVGPESAGSSGAADTTTIGFENASGTFAIQSSETRDSIAAALPFSLRGSASATDTGVCGSSCPACPADYDQDGGVTGSDVSSFFADFEQGLPCSDTDQDGGITGSDVATFFQFFEAGGC